MRSTQVGGGLFQRDLLAGLQAVQLIAHPVAFSEKRPFLCQPGAALLGELLDAASAFVVAVVPQRFPLFGELGEEGVGLARVTGDGCDLLGVPEVIQHQDVGVVRWGILSCADGLVGLPVHVAERVDDAGLDLAALLDLDAQGVDQLQVREVGPVGAGPVGVADLALPRPYFVSSWFCDLQVHAVAQPSRPTRVARLSSRPCIRCPGARGLRPPASALFSYRELPGPLSLLPSLAMAEATSIAAVLCTRRMTPRSVCRRAAGRPGTVF
ncbi:hypothetical protein [Streptomyces sp. f51]|uniref:hypothetical protein n=1 Tax=Streptomyces sp. f51 TaxID=1827742 RepID=UPI00117CC7E8|nr:hypothetical protein [Streptomyces sp. f51]